MLVATIQLVTNQQPLPDPSLPDSGVDLYCGIGGSPEGVLAAAALRALGGDMLLRMWPRDEVERKELLTQMSADEFNRVFRATDLVTGESAVFCATGISDSALLPGVKLMGKKAITHSFLMRARSRTVRYIRAVHDLETKTIHLRSVQREQKLLGLPGNWTHGRLKRLFGK